MQNTSFAAGSQDLQVLAGLNVPEKPVERLSKRIGQERVDQRQQQVQAFEEFPVMAKFGSPVAHPPELAVVSMDGGRLPILDRRVSPDGEAAGSAPAAAVAPREDRRRPARVTGGKTRSAC